MLADLGLKANRVPQESATDAGTVLDIGENSNRVEVGSTVDLIVAIPQEIDPGPTQAPTPTATPTGADGASVDGQGVRSMADIDLLVAPADGERFHAMMTRDLGYTAVALCAASASRWRCREPALESSGISCRTASKPSRARCAARWSWCRSRSRCRRCPPWRHRRRRCGPPGHR